MSRLSLSFWGSPCVDLGGVPVKLPRHKAMALLAYLGVTAGRHHRNTLATLLWPDYAQSQARTYLRITFSQLKQTLGNVWFDVQQHTIGLYIARGIWIDTTHFFDLLALCAEHGHWVSQPCPACLPTLADAVSLYRGEFLAGFTLPDSAEFDRWQEEQATNLRHQLTQAFQGLVTGYRTLGELDTAVRYAQQWLAVDSWQELAHQQLIQLYAALGAHTAALEQYNLYVHTLDQEMGLPPNPEITELIQMMWADHAAPAGQPAQPQTEPVRTTLDSKPPELMPPIDGVRHNLPTLLPPFFGREPELTRLEKLLIDPQCRLITLVGLGGMGKTRLALQVAQTLVHNGQPRVQEIFPHGIYFIPLAPAHSIGEALSTIAHFLNMPVHGREKLKTQLHHYLQQKQLLLVLDNLEHLIPEADSLTDILRAAPGVKILATSRERLRLPEEWVIAIEGLAFPAEGEIMVPVQACHGAQHSAVQLFVQRAQRLFATFSPAAEMPHIVKICQLLEGMPLGLELAASWIRLFSCAEICKEMEHNLSFLAAQQQDISPRHRSLAFVFDHSWALLTGAEQTAFCQLAVFSGGFTREAAHWLGVGPGMLAALLDRSLLQRQAASRYDMHGVVRQFAADKLQAMPALAEQARHNQAHYFAAFLREREQGIKSSAQKNIFQEIGQEMANIQISWAWMIAQEEVGLLPSFLMPLSFYLSTRGLFHEGVEMYAHACQRLVPTKQIKQTEEVTAVLGSLLAHYGRFHYCAGNYQQAVDYLQQGLAFLQSAEAEDALPFVLSCLGDVSRALGDHKAARRYLEESLSISSAIGDEWESARTLNMLGVLTARTEGPGEKAQAYFEKSVALYKKTGDVSYAGGILANLGIVAVQTGKHAEAELFLSEAITISREIENQHALAVCLSSLANVAYIKGEYDKAERYLQESYKINLEMGNLAELAICLNHRGALAYMRETYDEAQNYFEQGLHIRQDIGDKWGVFNSLLNLGDTAYRLGSYNQARDYCEQGLVIAQALEDSWSIADAKVRMARCALALGAYGEARHYLYETLKDADQKYSGAILRALVCFAALCLHEGTSAPAVEILKWIAAAHCSSQEIRKDAVQLLTQLGRQVSDVPLTPPDQDEMRVLKQMATQVLLQLEGKSC